LISITERSEAALTAMSELALAGEDVLSIPDLARRSGVTVPVLEQLLPALRRGGLVESRRGVKGGYRLAREAAQIEALQIVEAVDGELSLSSGKYPPWDAVVDGLREQLAAMDLAGLAAAREQAAGGPMYYI
jgi:Rrf2 family protein